MRDGSDPAGVAVLVPARDEAEALPPLLDALRDVDPGPGAVLGRVLVVDNGSSDATPGVARAGGAEVVSEPRPGYGRACLRGIAALAARPGPPPAALVFLDADDRLAPRQLPRLLAPVLSGAADLVIGERRAPAGDGVRWHASLGNRLVTTSLRGLYGSPVRDLGPFRALRWDRLPDLALDDRGYGWYVQMQVRALKAGYRVVSVPVEFGRREVGRSKVSGSWRGSVAAGAVILATLAREVARPPLARAPLPLRLRGPAADATGGGKPGDGGRDP